MIQKPGDYGTVLLQGTKRKGPKDALSHPSLCMFENVPAPSILPTPPDFRSYFIELRIGTPEWRLSRSIEDAGKRYGLLDPEAREKPLCDLKPSAPHISLYGGFTLREGFSLGDVKRIIKRLCKKTCLFHYRIEGFESRLGYSGGVLAFRVSPSDPMREFRASLIQELRPVTHDLFPMNNDPADLWYHITVGYRLSSGTYERMETELVPADPGTVSSSPVAGKIPAECGHYGPLPKSLHPVCLPADTVRVTVLHRNRVVAELDLLTGTWLNRHLAKSTAVWSRTLSRYRLMMKYELTGPVPSPGKPVSFVLADPDFGVSESIRRYARPFPEGNARVMDQVLVRNWNRSVRQQDEVYLIGDAGPGDRWEDPDCAVRLNGRVHLIPPASQGTPEWPETMKKVVYEGVSFVLIHDPDEAPMDFDGYVVHGRYHNDDLDHYPFYEPGKRRFNVCAELTGYCPIPLSLLCETIRKRPEGVLTLR